jgi:hypothetical protein
MMNAAYGICGLKPVGIDVKYIKECEKDNFTQNHFNEIRCFNEMPNKQFRYECYKPIDNHFNRQHCAAEILSYSKRIMNDVMCLAEDIDVSIFYTDTDSMHIETAGLPALERAFFDKFGRVLTGTELGQFHSNFSFRESMHIVLDKNGRPSLKK